MIETLLRDLSMELNLGYRDLMRIITTAPRRYKIYQIPKRRGGTRTIAQPSRELKAIQRFVLKRLLSKLPVHRAATAYVIHQNIGENALAHVKNRVILKLDFTNFFPSITVRDWERYTKAAGLQFERGELALYSYILFWGQRSNEPECLSIGAPTSPILSNILLFELDTKLSDAAKRAGVTYTRYADDITASAKTIEDVRRFEASARSIVRQMKSPRLSFNDEKRGLYTMGQRRMVTGLIVTPTGQVSIGRERKRLISAMLHKVVVGKSDPESMGTLKGLLGFCLATEPDFVSRMRAKYGNETIDRVIRYHIARTGPPRPRQ
jgi:RNA-directed DNA polymerase